MSIIPMCKVTERCNDCQNRNGCEEWFNECAVKVLSFTIHRSWLGELNSNGIDKEPTEEDMRTTMRRNNIESIFVELHNDLKTRQSRLILRVESVRSNMEV